MLGTGRVQMTMLQRMMSNPMSWQSRRHALLIYNPMRLFAAQDVPEPKTISELEAMGMANLALTKRNGLDYERILNTKKFGLTNK